MIDTSLDELRMLEKNHNAKRQEINLPPTGKTTVYRIKMRFTYSGRLSEAFGC